MALQVVSGAMMTCTFGMAPSTLNILPKSRVMATAPAGNIMDMVPNMNIPPFGMCQSLSNPQVAAATAAALGVLTPMPCIPVPAGPWKPGSPTVMIGGMQALTNSCMANCAWGGMIQFSMPGQTNVMTA
ncbi:MAG: DUF4280 domain-containing protein [Ilumatobacteraceae bacterium]|jgi:hypothetical protein